ncbi:S-methyl-5'-thioadenosine phosphorylase [Aeromicrobium chenweiae]|uniref:S-methyl-5'-thioadenosine phosphorylase n=1 Tax=Aeromicrobium chenweiae TaxID=2079793 RepID=A0A2S0WR14_9ACTN|nr:S-methyl-5'-thioadenosine phosphorylase [Aeromicrobium chenweiae]AWB93803.1 5'-methylthioadenosine phosphorylase [Aeromicrobium chenweiae]TGN30848.1 S-methyl-5'-thioadenosine phosphorylase [Aeromicrobium chenweiae]
MTKMPRPDVAVIGGSGFYTFLDDPREIEVDTPYGKPSAPIAVGTVEGRAVAFLPRHGSAHDFPAHTVPYRANMWALRSLGVRQVLAPCAVGGLQVENGPGTFLVPDQLIDRTTGRAQTYFDTGACHISFSDPYCPRLREHLLTGLSEQQPVDGGTMVVVDGPRFSTRAESRWYADQGWAVVNMTGHPEAVLARELALCYATVALVTDYDAGVDEASSVSMDAVFEVFAEHTGTLKKVLGGVVAGLGSDRDCGCSHALDGMDLPVTLP